MEKAFSGFTFEKKAVAEAVQNMMETMDKDAKTIWDSYTHEIIKEQFTFDEIEKLVYNGKRKENV